MELGLRSFIWAIFLLSILQCTNSSPINLYTAIELTCDEKFSDILQEYEHKEYPSNGFLVHCSNCSVTEDFGDDCDFRVYGTGTYWKDTSVCCGAMHSGILTSEGGYVRIFKKETENGVTSESNHQNNIFSKPEYDDYYSYYYKKESEPAETTQTATKEVTAVPSTTKAAYESDLTVKSTERAAFIPTSSSNNSHSSPNSFSNNNNNDKQKVESTTKQHIDSTTQITQKSQVDNEIVTTSLSQQKYKRKHTTSKEVQGAAIKNVSKDIDQNIRPVEIDISTIEKIGQKTSSIVVKPVARNLYENDFKNNQKSIPAASTWMYKGIGIGASAVVVFIIILVLGKKLYSNRRSLIRAVNKNSRRSNKHEGCVCYVAMETSTQGLLTDPETCERDCSKKKEMQAGVDSSDDSLVSDGGCENKCSECTGDNGCHGDKYEF